MPNQHIDFIRRISSNHPEYGEDRIALELEVKSGIRHACSTVRRYMVKRRPGPTDSQAWRSFLKNQAKAMWSCDFFVQHTVGFRVLYVKAGVFAGGDIVTGGATVISAMGAGRKAARAIDTYLRNPSSDGFSPTDV